MQGSGRCKVGAANYTLAYTLGGVGSVDRDVLLFTIVCAALYAHSHGSATVQYLRSAHLPTSVWVCVRQRRRAHTRSTVAPRYSHGRT